MARLEAASVGARVRRLLSTADAEPSSVPPSSILIVRALADPARGALLHEAGAHVAPAHWIHATRGRLDDMQRQASRPADGPVPASAPCVFFHDEAELLACLSRDVLFGTLSRCWWWQAWLRATSSSAADAVLRAWVRAARHVPAAIGILHRAGLAAAWAGSLSARDARALFVAMTGAHELPALAAPTPPAEVGAIIERAARPRAAPHEVRVRGDHEHDAPPTARTDRANPPWDAFVSAESVPARLGLEQRTLLGVALTLWRAPLAARTRAFQETFHAWRRAEQFAAPSPAPITTPIAAPEEMTAEPEGAAEKMSAVAETVTSPEGARPPNVEPPAPAPSGAVTSSERAAGLGELARSEPVVTRTASLEPPPTGAAAVPMAGEPRIQFEAPHTAAPAGVVAERAAAGARAAMERGAVVPAVDTETALPSPIVPLVALPASRTDSVRTSLAGVLFLINALQRLELFDRLDDHFGVTASLGGWAWLEIVARGLLGDGRQDAALDPIWEVLAALDGRPEGAAIAGTFRGPRSYRLPEGWPAPDRVEAASGPPWPPLGMEPQGDLRLFLGTLIPYLRWRLLGALGFDDDVLLVSRLLYRRGRLTCSSTHVDVFMGMDQIDIAVRLAGLDVNPGWVPALGRVVTFYFEQE